MRRLDLAFRIVALPLDFLMVIAAGFAAMALRLSPAARELRPVLFHIPMEQYLVMLGVVACGMIGVFAVAGLYSVKLAIDAREEFVRIVFAASAGLIGIVFFMFFRQEWFDSRFLILAGWVFTILFTALGRGLLGIAKQIVVLRFRVGAHRVLLIGSDRIAEELRMFFEHNPGMGVSVVKHIGEVDINELARAIGNPGVDEVVLTDSHYSRERILELIDFCDERRLIFKFVPNLFQTLTRNTGIEIIGGVPLVEMKRTPLEGWGRVLKRIIDTVGAGGGIILFGPLMLVIAFAVRRDSPGPVLYRNRRVGARGEFDTLKFRTMRVEFCTGEGYPNVKGAEEFEAKLIAARSIRQGPVPKVLNDPRRTRMGHVLERTSLDELPQFFNVLFGHMSLVGPRPHRPREVAQYAKHHRKVFAVKPGITGLAQISGRSDLDFEDEVKLDVHYIENWSLWFDLIILLKTPFVVLLKRHRS